MGCLFTVPEYNPEDYTQKEDDDFNNLIEPLTADEEEEEQIFAEQQKLLKEVAQRVAEDTERSGADETGGYVDPEVRAASAPSSAVKAAATPVKSPKVEAFMSEQKRLAEAKRAQENEEEQEATTASKSPVQVVVTAQKLSFSGHVDETQKQAQSEKHALLDTESVISGAFVNADDNASVVSDLTSVMSADNNGGEKNNNNKKGKNKNKNKNKNNKK
jgi:hypothetical protein